jgi:hypothetical protein
MDESFVEYCHQVLHRAHHRLINVPDKERTAMCAVKHDAIATYKEVSAHLLKVNKSATRALNDIDPSIGNRKKVQEKFDHIK